MTTFPPERFFCAQSARERQEHLFGTAPEVRTWILLEHPRPWTAKAFPDDRLPVPVRRHIARLIQQTHRSRPLLIRQSNTQGEELQLFALHTGEHHSHGWNLGLRDYGDLLNWDGPALTKNPADRPWTEPLFLVCTHGKHDRCCAKFGFATYNALRQHAGAAVWECSHVGGDRFAANVLCLPEGIYYGHVLPEDAPDLITAQRRGEILLKHYRGRSCYTRTAQVAEYFIRHETGLTRLTDLTFLDACTLERNRWMARFHSPRTAREYHVEFKMRAGEGSARMTCSAEIPQPVREYELCAYHSTAR